jgi:superfamily II DNA helicase RecQ
MHFVQGDRPFWSVLIEYEIVLDPDNAEHVLNKADKLLYVKLKEWRRNKAQALGLPPFLVATNKQLLEVVKDKIQTVSGLDGIKGFGQKKIANYGKEMVELVSQFYKNGKTS